jgi:hypothetical protein
MNFLIVILITFDTQLVFGVIFNTHLILDMTSPAS